MFEYINKQWVAKLSASNLINFDAFWDLPNKWFEEVNRRRNGWSGVITKTIGKDIVFIKKQENHNFKTWRHPFNGEPTFAREFRNIQILNENNINSLEVVFFGIKGNQCILATKDLNKEYQSLENILKKDQKIKLINLEKIANALSLLHQKKIQHTYPLPKHIYINKKNQSVLFIDLEKMKKRTFRFQCSIRDLYSFLKFTITTMNKEELDYFFKKYFKKSNPSLIAKYIRNKVLSKLKIKL